MYGIDFDDVSKRLQFVSNLLVSKRLCNETTEINFGSSADSETFSRSYRREVVPFGLEARGQQKDTFLEGDDTSDKLGDYDLEKLGCPFKILKNEPFKPVIDLYDGELFLEEVDTNYVLWEQQGRAGFEYSATMKEAGCIREAQSWELMIKSMQGTNKEAAWSKQNFSSCFEDPPSEPVSAENLNQAYEIMNSSSVSHILWTDDGIFIFTLTVIDPEFSFCNLTVEFAVQVICARSLFQELPTFVTLGSCCLTIMAVLFSAYYITTFFPT
ncbi:cation channel sperm-associated auxiliary subunit epsilon-like [Acropora muricata]|uniref:cation channel sperm-associated auxiliary subunit epsilon-like n=1 Tax=Acropora muricata TaxID=159855 RepID=UPI0034E3E36B